jgi:hypothetical protein
MEKVIFHMKQLKDQALDICLEYFQKTEAIEISRDVLTLMGAIWSTLLLFKLINGLRAWASPKYQGGQL